MPIEKPQIVRTDIRRPASEAERLASEQDLSELCLTSITHLEENEARRWAEHPDELVAITFARLVAAHQVSQSRERGQIDASLPEIIALRAVEDAERRGELWTPLLDIVVDFWNAYPEIRDIVQSEERLSRFHDWAKSIDDPETFRGLARFSSMAAKHVQFESAGTIPEDLLRHWVRNSSDALRLLRNDRLRDRHLIALLNRIFELSSQGIGSLGGEICKIPPEILADLSAEQSDALLNNALAGGHEAILYELLPKMSRVSPDVLQELIDSNRSHRLRAAAMLHPNVLPETRERLLEGQYGFDYHFVNTLVSSQRVDEEVMWAVWNQKGKDVAASLLYHPGIPNKLAMSIIQNTSLQSLDRALNLSKESSLASRPAIALTILRHPEGESYSGALLRLLSKSPTAGDALEGFAFSAAVEAVLKTTPEEGWEAVATALDKRLEQGELMLKSDLVTQLLSHKHRQIREVVVKNLSKIRDPLPEEVEELENWQFELESLYLPPAQQTKHESHSSPSRPTTSRRR